MGVILSPEFKANVVEVSRQSDRLIKLKLVIAGEIFNIVSAYAPQSGETEKIKEFLKDWEDVMSRVPRTEKIVVGADINGHVGKNPGVFQRVHGVNGYGQRNREGEKILQSMESLGLALVNTFFNKNEEHLITYKSGGNSSQIDFIMTGRADLKEMRECKVIPREEVVSQNRLLWAVLRTKEAKQRRRTREKRIKIWTLKGEKVTEYRDKVEEEYQLEADTNAEESWKLFKNVVMRAAEEVCGTIKGGKHLERETWWWNEEVQENLRRKKDAFKKWQMQGGNELKEAYKNTKR